jgi:hypothetical protein
MVSRACAVAGTLLVVLAVPAGAQALPTIEPLRPCYVTAGTTKDPQGEGVLIRAQGFTANSKVDLTLNGAPVKDGTGLQVGDTGLLALPPFPAPFVRSGSADFSVTLTEQTNAANTVTATAKSTRLGVKIRPKSARPSQRIRFTGSGFTEDKPVWAHYTRNGKQVKRVRMVRRPGECGSWSVRRRQFPMKHPAQGVWWVQYDQSKKFATHGKHKPAVRVRVKFTVTLVPR